MAHDDHNPPKHIGEILRTGYALIDELAKSGEPVAPRERLDWEKLPEHEKRKLVALQNDSGGNGGEGQGAGCEEGAGAGGAEAAGEVDDGARWQVSWVLKDKNDDMYFGDATKAHPRWDPWSRHQCDAYRFDSLAAARATASSLADRLPSLRVLRLVPRKKESLPAYDLSGLARENERKMVVGFLRCHFTGKSQAADIARDLARRIELGEHMPASTRTGYLAKRAAGG